MLEMGFLGYIRDVMSGKIAKSNQLIGNHGLRICEKVEIDASLLGVIVGATAYYTTDFLVELLFGNTLMERFKYNDGTEEPNPFKENLDRLDEKSSYEMFKLVAGNFLVGFFAEGFLRDDETRIIIPGLRDQFFNIYEYNDEDREIFYELLKLAQNDLLGEGRQEGLPFQAFRLYEYIFKKAYKINPPEYPGQILKFIFICKERLIDVFVPGLVEAIKTVNKR
jgi:hypothetical protein